jgi:hypothetical protein
MTLELRDNLEGEESEEETPTVLTGTAAEAVVLVGAHPGIAERQPGLLDGRYLHGYEGRGEIAPAEDGILAADQGVAEQFTPVVLGLATIDRMPALVAVGVGFVTGEVPVAQLEEGLEIGQQIRAVGEAGIDHAAIHIIVALGARLGRDLQIAGEAIAKLGHDAKTEGTEIGVGGDEFAELVPVTGGGIVLVLVNPVILEGDLFKTVVLAVEPPRPLIGLDQVGVLIIDNRLGLLGGIEAEQIEAVALEVEGDLGAIREEGAGTVEGGAIGENLAGAIDEILATQAGANQTVSQLAEIQVKLIRRDLPQELPGARVLTAIAGIEKAELVGQAREEIDVLVEAILGPEARAVAVVELVKLVGGYIGWDMVQGLDPEPEITSPGKPLGARAGVAAAASKAVARIDVFPMRNAPRLFIVFYESPSLAGAGRDQGG